VNKERILFPKSMKCSWDWDTVEIEDTFECNDLAVWISLESKSHRYGICNSFPVYVYYSREITGCKVSKPLWKLIYPQSFELELLPSPVTSKQLKFTLLDSDYRLESMKLLQTCTSLSSMWRDELIANNGKCSLTFLDKEYLFQCVDPTQSASLLTIDFDTQISIETNSLRSSSDIEMSFCRHMKSATGIASDLIQKVQQYQQLLRHSGKGLGYILHGARGVGKTYLVQEVLKQCSIRYSYKKSIDLLRPIEGETESLMVRLFAELERCSPSILVIDDADDLVETAGPYLPQLIMELIETSSIMVILVCSRFHLIPSSWRSSGVCSFIRELSLPDFMDRIEFIKFLFRVRSVSDAFCRELAALTQGFSTSDLQNVLRQTLLRAGEMFSLEDVKETAKLIQPSNLAGISSSIPTTRFSDLYGIQETLESLNQLIIKPFQNELMYVEKCITPPKGILLHGPSGVGKTALACSIANELGMACIFVSSPSIRSKIVGESEKIIASLFSQARSSAPCVLLIDQIDAVLSKRGNSSSSQGSGDRIITTFLTEMDGIFTQSNRSNVFIVASKLV
jgi:SpoVK/Ycf46/Vps4 family AAA+-type ATPase